MADLCSFDDDNGDVSVRDVKPGGTGDAELDEIMQEQAEEERRQELLPALRKRVLARWREERLEKGYTVEEADNPPEADVDGDVERALKEKLTLERFNEKVKHDPLYWFGHVTPPKDLVAAKRHFSNCTQPSVLFWSRLILAATDGADCSNPSGGHHRGPDGAAAANCCSI